MIPFTRSLDPNKGELLFDVSRNTWRAGDPDAEAYVNLFRTDLGTYIPDPTMGWDMRVLSKRGTGAEAGIKRELERASKRISVPRGHKDVTFLVEIQGEHAIVQLSYTTRSGRRVGPIQVIP